MAYYCVLKNLPCAFLIFTIHYTFPIDHTLDFISLTVFYKDWILWHYNMFPSCYTLPLGCKYSHSELFLKGDCSELVCFMLHMLIGSTVQRCQQPHESCLENWYQSTLHHIPKYKNFTGNFLNEHTAVKLLPAISSNVHFRKLMYDINNIFLQDCVYSNNITKVFLNCGFSSS